MSSRTFKISIYLFVFLLIGSCGLLRKENMNRRSVFSLNAIQADQDYYTKAVLEYHLVNTILKKEGKVNRQTVSGKTIDTMLLNVFDPSSYQLLSDCRYRIPKELKDLNSGFQYRYYLFSGESTAAMQAFGITDISSNYDTKYLIIDYIQYKDCKCESLPTIRYAVGIRSELKISSVKAGTDISGIGGLANLAAQVELEQAEVNFSLKTIGITGDESRFNIPQGVSFDVTTYKDFQNSIEFIKEKIGNRGVEVHPELIPVMDAYRPNTQQSLDGLTNKIIALHKKTKRIDKINDLSSTAKDEIKLMYDNEIKRLLKRRNSLDEINQTLYALERYKDLLDRTMSIQEQKTNIREYERNFARFLTEDNTDYFPGNPKISALNESKLEKLDDIYLFSDSITTQDFEAFLSSWEQLGPTEQDLDLILDDLEKTEDPNVNSLNGLIQKIKNLRNVEEN